MKKTYVEGSEFKKFRKEVLHKEIHSMAAFLGRTDEAIEKFEDNGIVASFDAEITKRSLELHLEHNCFTPEQRVAVEAFVAKLA